MSSQAPLELAAISVSASYSGPGSDSINPCFEQATDGVKLSADAGEERTVISIELDLHEQGTLPSNETGGHFLRLRARIQDPEEQRGTHHHQHQ